MNRSVPTIVLSTADADAAAAEANDPSVMSVYVPLARVKPDRWLHWILLLLAGAVIVAAAMLGISNGTRVVVPLFDYTLPEMCAARRWLGVSCPGCGMTRSFIAIMHGELARAWAFNPAGYALFAVVAFQLPYRTLQLRRIRRGLPEWNPVWLNWSWLVVAIALFAQWLGRI